MQGVSGVADAGLLFRIVMQAVAIATLARWVLGLERPAEAGRRSPAPTTGRKAS
jgi:hypothetical protein